MDMGQGRGDVSCSFQLRPCGHELVSEPVPRHGCVVMSMELGAGVPPHSLEIGVGVLDLEAPQV